MANNSKIDVRYVAQFGVYESNSDSESILWCDFEEFDSMEDISARIVNDRINERYENFTEDDNRKGGKYAGIRYIVVLKKVPRGTSCLNTA